MARVALQLVVSSLIWAHASADCDQEYECEFLTLDGHFYDLKGMCGGVPYYYLDPTSGNEFYYQICGNIDISQNINCIPYGYDVLYQRGVAMQFFGGAPPAGPLCIDQDTQLPVNCTRDCEVLGVGAPVISLFDPSVSWAGVNVTHTGVASLNDDNFHCPPLPGGGFQARSVTFAIMCDVNAGIPAFQWIREYATCQYEVVLKSKLGCGCRPDCQNKNCGSDGCGGYCGGGSNKGACPYPYNCITSPLGSSSGLCCAPDCNNRQCGTDGCGGSCGSCGDGYDCNRYRQCIPTAISPSPLPVDMGTATISTTTSGDYTAAYVGGIISAGFVTIGMSWFSRLRSALAAAKAGYGSLPGGGGQ